MIKNTVIIDTSASPTKIEFPSEFNVQFPLLTAILMKAGGKKIIIHSTSGEKITYGQFLRG